MKSYLMGLSLLVLVLPNLFGKIRNGYENDLPHFTASLQSLQEMLSTTAHLSAAERRRIKKKINTLMNYMVYYQITTTLLERFRTIAPDLYEEIDRLEDSRGRKVDVYVKFMPEEGSGLLYPGQVSFSPSGDDATMCSSEYGETTASVKIWIRNNSLLVLAHEFGHLRYMVPNLAQYVSYYERTYGFSNASRTFGHRPGDPSGMSAMKFETRYRDNYARYLKLDFERLVSPPSLIALTKQSVLKDMTSTPTQLVAGQWWGPQ